MKVISDSSLNIDWAFTPIAGRDLRIGARIDADGQLQVRVFDMQSNSVFDSDPICNVEACCAEALVESIKAAIEKARK